MENKTKLTMGIAVALTLILGSGATYFFGQGDDSFYCNSRNIVMICEKISSGIGTRCYYEETYKVCTEGWEKIEIEQSLKQEEIINSKQIRCDQKECVPI
ncbi:hypothetical protein LCGC14_2245470 [marine sediment metagenome]|uniref:Uncharacterized protein n=2 Tax=marine sediment metagenome TaxID=412755 RepID=A0A0F9D3W7_9ZZZZ